jgi:general secretion pathway protein J
MKGRGASMPVCVCLDGVDRSADRHRGTATAQVPGRSSGFTLIEVLVAVAIFVIVGMLAMTGYNELVTQSDRIESAAGRTRAIQTAMSRIAQDFATLEPRPVREPLGQDLDYVLRASGTGDELVELTHSGWSNPAGVPRPTLQRVAYRLEDGKLRREYWAVLDRTMTDEPVSVVMLDKVKSFSTRFMGADHDWKDQWPPLGYSGPDARVVRPLAVEITVELDDWGKIMRIVEVSG